MAQVPSVGAPQVAPNTSPTPGYSVNPAPDAFLGGVVGQAAEKAGAVSQQTSDALQQHAIQFQQLNNQVAANKQAFAASDAINEYIKNYKTNNTGMAAFANQGQAYKDFDDIATKGGQNLPLSAQVEYDQYVRRQIAVGKQQLTSYAVEQRRWETGLVAKAQDEQAQSTFSTNFHDPNAETQFYTTVANGVQMRQQVGLLPNDPDVTKAAIQEGLSKGYSAVVKSIYDNQGVDAANSYFNAHRANFTPAAAIEIEGSFRTAKRANMVDGVGQASVMGGDVNLGGGLPPTKNWDAGLASFRADPTTALAGLGIQGATVTSGARTPDHNAAVGGSPTSEHLTNSAWDFKPPAGMSLQQAATTLATNLHNQGIPYDQIEIDNDNGHVHVGFGQQNRNETIDQTGARLDHPSAASTIHFDPIPIGPNTDPATVMATAITRAEQVIQAHPELPPADKQAILASAERNARVATVRIDAQQKSTFDTIENWMVANDVHDIAAVQKQFPNEWNNLPAKYQTPIQHLARQPDESTWQAEADLNNQRFNNTTGFLNADIRSMPLTPAEKVHFLGLQSKMQADVKSGKALDTSISQALHDPDVTNALRSANISNTVDPQQYGHFLGALGAQFEAYRDSPKGNGQLPQGKDRMTIVNNLLAQSTKPVGFLGMGQKPLNFDAAHDTVRDSLVKAGYANPTEDQIWTAYNLGLHHGR